MTVAEFVGVLGLKIDAAAFAKGQAALGDLQSGYRAVAEGVKAVVVKIADMVEGLQSQGAALDDASNASGVTTDALQELGYAAKLSGASAEEMRLGLTHLARVAAAAANGNEEASATFRKLGVSVRDSNGHIKSADKLFLGVSDGLNNVHDDVAKTAIAMDLFSRGGARLLVTLKEGSVNLGKMGRAAHEFGIILDKDTIAAAAKLDDSMDNLHFASDALKDFIAGPLLVPIRKFVDALMDWWRANNRIVKQRIESVLGAIVKVLQAMAAVIGSVIDHWQGLAFVLGSVLLGVILANTAAIYAQIAGWVGIGIASTLAAIKSAAAWVAATWPFILLGALLILLADEIYEFATDGDSIIGDLVEIWRGYWRSVKETASEVWTAIGVILREWVDEAGRGLGAFFTWIVGRATALKDSFLALMTDIGSFVTGLADRVVGFVESIIDRIKAPLKTVVDGARQLFGGGDAAGAHPVVQGLAQAARSPGGINAMFGPGASSPAASAAMQSSVSNAKTTNVNAPVDIRVVAGPGQSPTEVGGAVRDAFADHMQRMLSETAATAGT